eukprot:CAMPEP_0115466320 /NCGR_PEP_ID=MMETSP0271-20121206/49856_1 /TAXON_ID=71861 /ORGANISM="Scrippsiella trochoidea, Strain CCMP3099" /LENGTH=412 /DNA_ID=CAMNT_0002893289 /DNA_START=1 /DNA_END=1239 /DNA_ORIENTATION=-
MGGAQASPEEAFVEQQRNKWAPENRPCDHPFQCDFRDALGLPKHMKFTRGDVIRYERQAARWWHSDKGAAPEAFASFKAAANVLMSSVFRKKYIDEVEAESQVVVELGEEIHWRRFNIRFMKMVDISKRGRPCVPKENSQPSEHQQEDPSLCHVFLDGTGSMTGGHIQKAKTVLRDLFPRFVMTPTAVHLVGTRSGQDRSRLLYPHSQDLEGKEQELMQSWTTEAIGTYLWEYIYDQTKDYAELNHEVIIITDGNDDGSNPPFKGLMGFQEIMRRMSGKQIRISLLLIGTSFPPNQVSVYRDLCMATGGMFHQNRDGDQNALVVQDFTAPLLLTEAERDALAADQRHSYQAMLSTGQATPFDWYLPLACGTSHRPASGTTSAPSTRSTGREQLPVATRVNHMSSQVTVMEFD